MTGLHYLALRASLGDRPRAARVPGWVARDLRTDLALGPQDPWPSGPTRHEVVLPELDKDDPIT